MRKYVMRKFNMHVNGLPVIVHNFLLDFTSFLLFNTSNLSLYGILYFIFPD